MKIRLSKDTLRHVGIGVLFSFLLFRLYSDTRWSQNWVLPWGMVVFALGLYGVLESRLRFFGKVFLLYYFTVGVFGASIQDKIEIAPILKFACLDQVVVLFAFLMFVRSRLNITPYLKVAAWVVSMGILLSADRTSYVTFMQNPSMASCFVVLASGIAPYSLILALLCHSWTACLAFAAGTLYRHRKAVFAKFCALGGALGLGVWVFLRGVPSNGRMQIWTTYFDLWWAKGVQVFGLSPGTSRVWLPFICFKLHPGEQIIDTFIWAHSDWLQLLMETGVTGLVLGLVAYGEIFCHTKRKPEVLAYAVVAMANMPAHWPLLALVGWSLVSE